ncbi:MAG: surface lipoprotein assembly modifier [Paenirhodobacter sp.]
MPGACNAPSRASGAFCLGALRAGLLSLLLALAPLAGARAETGAAPTSASGAAAGAEAADARAEAGARALAAAGRRAEALARYRAWVPATRGGAERRLWAIATLARAEGRADLARAALERLVVLRPDVARFRLELAAALQAAGEAPRVRFHYEAALGGTLAAPERRAAEGALVALAQERRWQGSLSFGLVPSSNPGRRTSAGTIVIDGLPVTVAGGSRAQAALGAGIGVHLAFAPVLGPGWQGRASLDLDAIGYDRAAVPSDVTLTPGLALIRRKAGGLRWEVGANFAQRWIEGQVYSRGPGLSLALSTPVGARDMLAVALTAQDLAYPGAPRSDGLRSRAMLRWSHALDPRFAIRAGLALERSAARVPSLAFRAGEVSFGASYAFEGGLSLGADLTLRHARYDGVSTLFGLRRKDDRQSLALSAQHRALTVSGFAPVLQLNWERQRSTLPVAAYRNLSLGLGLSRRF